MEKSFWGNSYHKNSFYKLPLVKPLLLALISEVLLCVISTLKNVPWENRTEVFDCCLKRSRNCFLCWKEAGTEPCFQDNGIGIPFSLCNCAVGERSRRAGAEERMLRQLWKLSHQQALKEGQAQSQEQLLQVLHESRWTVQLMMSALKPWNSSGNRNL